MSEFLLKRHRVHWEKKPVLRAIYAAWYKEIIGALKPGKTLELGGGSGNFKAHFPEAVTSDLIPLPWLDLVLDAHDLPLRDSSIFNAVLFDVLHHLENPRFFFDEVVRVLRPGGRVLLLEPHISLASYPIYRFFHQESMDMSQDPFELRYPSPHRAPFDSNQALTTLFFFRYKRRFQEMYPSLRLIRRHCLGFFAYPLSGGFDHPSLLPLWALRPVLLMERFLGFLSPILAFRLFVVLEKQT